MIHFHCLDSQEYTTQAHAECPFSLCPSSKTNTGILSVAKHKGIRVIRDRH
ncbi:Uncharacterized protein DAT39_013199 [Clarias magur]|uniref:Uncharacterized protein n=1 Tax=Clarias magur TaxID=1594786 RepID=A0A8J4TG58_CLAMG|nr:Uncharacterized protein DAT39_013199 [Clarias magur]